MTPNLCLCRGLSLSRGLFQKEVAANHSWCPGGGSKVTLGAKENATYRMLVDGYNGKQGEFTLRVIDKR